MFLWEINQILINVVILLVLFMFALQVVFNIFALPSKIRKRDEEQERIESLLREIFKKEER